MIRFESSLKQWTNGEGSWHFLSVPADCSGEIKAHSLGSPRGFGSVRVAVTIDDVSWRTSLFPSRGSESYFLPVKADICRKLGIGEGDRILVSLDLLL